MNKERVGLTIWRTIFPLLLFLAVDTVLTMILMYGYMGYEAFELAQSGKKITQETIKELTENSTNFVMKYSLWLVILRSVILIPIFFVFMNKDNKRARKMGTYVEYESYNRAWLLILIPIGFVSCIGFNNFVSIVIDGLQSALDSLLSSLGTDFEYNLMEGFESTANVIYSGGIVLQILVTCVCAPLVEETLMRGLMYKRLRGIMGATPCMLITSAIFGLIHMNIVQFIYAFCVGIICAYVYEKFKTIVAPIILHCSANFLSVMVTFAISDTQIPNDEVPSIGYYMLLTVICLAIIFALLFIVEKKLNRKAIVAEPREESLEK